MDMGERNRMSKGQQYMSTHIDPHIITLQQWLVYALDVSDFDENPVNK